MAGIGRVSSGRSIGRAVALAAALLLAHEARAQQTPEQGYEGLIAEAVQEFEAAHWIEARALFLRAHEQKPSARTFRGLGFVEFELRNYLRADEYLRQALADSRHALTASQRREVEAAHARVQGFLGLYRIEVVPGSAQVLVDGATPGHVQDGSIVLEAGEHVLSFSAEGHAPLERRLDVRGGERESLRIELQAQTPGAAANASVEASVAGVRDPTPSSGGTQRVLGWVGVGAGALGLAAGIAMVLRRSSKLSEADAICPTGDCGAISTMELASNNQRIRELTSDADTAGTLGAIGLAAGGALAIAGVALLFTAPDGEGELSARPAIAPGRYGIMAAVTWR